MSSEYCIEVVQSPGMWSRPRRCTNRKKYGYYCGVHSPEKRRERDAARGPSKWELKMAARRRQEQRLELLEEIVSAARTVDEGAPVNPVVPYQLHNALAALDQFDAENKGS